jgi:hypothetical protein
VIFPSTSSFEHDPFSDRESCSPWHSQTTGLIKISKIFSEIYNRNTFTKLKSKTCIAAGWRNVSWQLSNDASVML